MILNWFYHFILKDKPASDLCSTLAVCRNDVVNETYLSEKNI